MSGQQIETQVVEARNTDFIQTASRQRRWWTGVPKNLLELDPSQSTKLEFTLSKDSQVIGLHFSLRGFPDSSAGKESTCNAEDPGSIPGSGRSALPTPMFLGFLSGSAGKESPCNEGDLGSIPGLGRSPGEGNDYPLQYSGLENTMDCTMDSASQRVRHE